MVRAVAGLGVAVCVAHLAESLQTLPTMYAVTPPIMAENSQWSTNTRCAISALGSLAAVSSIVCSSLSLSRLSRFERYQVAAAITPIQYSTSCAK